MTSFLNLRRIALVTALAVLVPLLGATEATARAARTALFHLALKRAEPGAGDTVAKSPKAIKLWFTESVSAATTGLRLVDAHGDVLHTGDLVVDAAPMSPAVAAVPETLKSGTYTVMWRAMADDGHPSTGKFSFSVK